jgi:hypothetical protein
MRTFSANDVQKFLAGVLACIGFQAVFRSALLLVGPSETDLATILVSAILSLALFMIGVRMFIGKTHGVSWAIMFLAFYMVLGLAGATRLYLTSSIAPSYFIILMVNLLAHAIVIGALLWYRFRMLPCEPNAEQSDAYKPPPLAIAVALNCVTLVIAGAIAGVSLVAKPPPVMTAGQIEQRVLAIDDVDRLRRIVILDGEFLRSLSDVVRAQRRLGVYAGITVSALALIGTFMVFTSQRKKS